MSKALLKAEYQKYTIERLLELRANRPELSGEAREAIEGELASRPEYDSNVIDEWRRRGDAYKRATRPLKAVVLLGVLPSLAAALLLPPERFAYLATSGLLLALAALFLLDVWYQRRMLACPNCGRSPLLESWRYLTLKRLRCEHCGPRL